MLSARSPLTRNEVRAAMGNGFSFNVAEAVLGQLVEIMVDDTKANSN